MKNKKTFLTATIAFLGLILLRSLYYTGISQNILNIAMVSLVIAFIVLMYAIKFISKDKSVAILPKGKNIFAGSFAILSAIALIVDGFYRISTSSNLEKLYNDLIEADIQKYMAVIIIIRSLLGFGFAALLILLAVSFFTGERKLSRTNVLISFAVLWGCARLLEFAFIDGQWATSAIKGIEIIGVVFLVLSLFSISKMHSEMYESKLLNTFLTQAWIGIPLVLTSSAFGFFDALTGPVKTNIIGYISEFCLALFVFFILKATESAELSDCEVNSSSFSKVVFDILDIAVSALTCVCVLLAIFFRTSTVKGPSMEDTLHDKDKVFMYSFMYTPKNNDIVVINPLESLVNARKKYGEDEKVKIIKRVIAVEGQTLHIDFDEHKVYVDGKELDESSFNKHSEMNIPTKEDLETNKYGNIPEKIPAGYIFVMGDNRYHSSDSRYSEIGLVPVEKVLGKAVFIYWPFNRIKKL